MKMQRDDDMDRLLRSAARHPAEAGKAGACLEPELVAALSEGGLTAAERTAAEAHAAGCDRCFAILAAVARTAPPPAPAGTNWLSLRWMVPAAAAAVIVLAVALQRAPSETPSPRDAVTVAAPATTARQSEKAAAPATEDSRARLAVPEGQSATARVANQSRARQETVAPQRKETKERVSEDAGAFAAATAKQTAARQAPADQVTQKPIASPAPPAAPPPPPPPAPTAVAESVAVGGARNEVARQDMRAVQSRLPVVIATPDPDVRWRITGASVQRSADGGRTWSAPAAVADREVLAGACAAVDVCWLVGRKGLVLLTTDGSTWRPLSPPEASADLISVTAESAVAATATSATGRTYRTSDGGRTWTAN